ATSPVLSKVVIKHVQLVRVSEDKALLIVVTDAGIVKDIVISIPQDLENDIIYQASKLMNANFVGKNTIQIRDMYLNVINAVHDYRLFFQEIMSVFDRCFAESKSELVLDGASNMLLHPEYSDIQRAKNLLDTLENKELMLRLLMKDSMSFDYEIKIKIGRENEQELLKDCSFIKIAYKIGNKNIGTIGVIGPTRMNYSKVVSVLHYMARSLSDVLTEMSGASKNDRGRG
ncbi:MAG TPA: HrcA family transcriptional regulator, partial [Clostridia bacterium]|nr:HrcA family transcriptional regulator [Clostridia bacterium]